MTKFEKLVLQALLAILRRPESGPTGDQQRAALAIQAALREDEITDKTAPR